MARLFQHRHYAIVADALAESVACHQSYIVDSFVRRFRNDNPRFDEARFRAACNDSPTTKDARSGKALR